MPIIAWTFACGWQGNLVFCPGPHPSYPLMGVFQQLVPSWFLTIRPMPVKCGYCQRERQRARLLLTKESAVARESDFEKYPFSLKSNTPYNPTEKHSVLLALTRADVCTPTKLVCSAQLWLVALGPCFWVPDDADSDQQSLCVVDAVNKFTQTAEVLWRKMDSTATL